MRDLKDLLEPLGDRPMPDRWDSIERRSVGPLPEVHRARVVAIGEHRGADVERQALLAGFQTHIAKPVDPAELTAAVASLAGRTGKSHQHQGGPT